MTACVLLTVFLEWQGGVGAVESQVPTEVSTDGSRRWPARAREAEAAKGWTRLSGCPGRVVSQEPELTLREQVFQVGLGQAAGESFLAQDVADRLSLALLKLPDLLFDGARSDEPVGVDGLGLANPV